jgi:hypothetical protein
VYLRIIHVVALSIIHSFLFLSSIPANEYTIGYLSIVSVLFHSLYGGLIATLNSVLIQCVKGT